MHIYIYMYIYIYIYIYMFLKEQIPAPVKNQNGRPCNSNQFLVWPAKLRFPLPLAAFTVDLAGGEWELKLALN